MAKMSGSDRFGIIEMLGGAEAYKARTTQAYEDKVERVRDKRTALQGKVATRQSMIDSLSGQKGLLSQAMVARIESIVPESTIAVGTSDTGPASDYATAQLAKGATPTAFDFRVDAVATIASVVLDKFKGSTHTAFTADEQMGAIGSVTIDGIGVDLNATDTVSNVVDKINANAQIQTAGLKAALLDCGSGQYKILISRTTSGLGATGGSITAGFDGQGNKQITSAMQGVIGSDSQITIAGQAITNPSNTFANVLPGISISVLKANAPFQHETVSVKQDAVKMSKSVTDLLTIVNDFATLLASQTQTTEDADGNTVGAESAFLYGTREIRQLSQLISDVFTVSKVGRSVTDLQSIGMSYKKVPADDAGPARFIVNIDDPALFNKVVTENPQGFLDLFYNRMTSTTHPNATLSYSFSDQKRLLPDYFANKDLIVRVNGALVSVDFGNGQGFQNMGTFASGKITFTGVLDGLVLGYSETVAGQKDFTINISQGIISKLEHGLKTPLKSLQTANQLDEPMIDKATQEVQKALAALKEAQQKAEQTLARIQALSMQASMFSQLFE